MAVSKPHAAIKNLYCVATDTMVFVFVAVAGVFSCFFYITFYTNNDSDKRALDPTRLINVDIIGATCTVCHEK